MKNIIGVYAKTCRTCLHGKWMYRCSDRVDCSKGRENANVCRVCNDHKWSQFFHPDYRRKRRTP